MYVYQFLSYNNRFEPAPVQVLLSEEITGSIRKLKVGLCSLAMILIILVSQFY